MCEPGLIISAVGTAISAYGQMQQGKAARGQAEYQAGVARNNKIMADRAAEDAIERGKVSERNQRYKTQQLIGEQRAVLAANGVVVDQGSALDITTDTAGIGELDALTIRSNATREALGFRQRAYNYGAEADLAVARGSAAQREGTAAAFGTLLSGTGKVASKWYKIVNKDAKE